MARTKTTYTKEFKLAILAQVESGIPVAQVARENGLCPQLIFKWRKDYRENPEKAFSGSGLPYKNEALIAELERTVGKLYAENEFLKKSLEKLNNRLDEEKQRSRHRRDTK